MLVTFSIITALLLVNALYVAAEFSTVSARRARLAHLAEDGNRLAKMVLPIVDDPQKLDTYAATCQLGITVSSLVVGFYAQAALVGTISPWLEQLGGLAPAAAASISATVILLVLSGAQVIVGELVPKNIGVQYPERLAMLTIVPLRWSIALFGPVIWFFRGSAQFVLRLFGIRTSASHAHIHSPEEIALLVRESGAGGMLENEERRLIEGALDLHKSTVRQIMVPRTRVVAAPVDLSCDELFTLLANSPFSRLPLYEGTIDNVVGVVHLKDLLCLRILTQDGQEAAAGENMPGDVQTVMGSVQYLPETMAADDALNRLRQTRSHVAVVVDEYGGTAGIVSLEDLVEEIFGELQDEFDMESPPLRVLPGGRVALRWDWLVEDLTGILQVNLPADSADTIGGLVLNELGQKPAVGDLATFGDLTLRVEKVDGHAIATVSIPVTPDQTERLREAAA